ncbi:MAG: hypothetical protein QM820_29655 [Minicystis sp.]
MRVLKTISAAACLGFLTACSHAPESTGAAAQEVCSATATANGGYVARCRHNLTYNGKDMGPVLFEHRADPSRSCDDYRSTAQLEGNAEAEPGEVEAILDDTTGKISYSVDSANITILLSDQKDWLWVRSSVAGAAEETEKKVYCPGLEEAAAQRAQTLGTGGPKECPGADPHNIELGAFPCADLEHEITSREAHKAMLAPNKIHKMAAGKVLVDHAEYLALKKPNADAKRAAVMPVLGVVFSALGSVFGSKEFQSAFQPKTKTVVVNGP